MPFMDTCTYCGREYPGMTVWVKKQGLETQNQATVQVENIRVCYSPECRLKAFSAGFDSLSEIEHVSIP